MGLNVRVEKTICLAWLEKELKWPYCKDLRIDTDTMNFIILLSTLFFFIFL